MSTADRFTEFRQWLERNGDAPCSCGHLLRAHLVDLSACPDCNTYEPVHLRCEGFHLAAVGTPTEEQPR
jgi:hypothetical protein